MDLAHRVGARQGQQVVAALELHVPVAEPLAAVVRLVEAVALHHRAETAVEQQDARGEKVAYVVRHFRMISISKSLLQFLPVTKMRLVAGS